MEILTLDKLTMVVKYTPGMKVTEFVHVNTLCMILEKPDYDSEVVSPLVAWEADLFDAGDAGLAVVGLRDLERQKLGEVWHREVL